MGKVIPHIRQSDLFPRQVERQLKEYIDFIWRSGDQTSDVLKVDRIPPKRMKDVIYEIYSPSIFCVKKGS